MKKIKTRYTETLEAFDKPTEIITLELLDKIYEPIFFNKIAIFNTVGSIERKLETIINYYFYGEPNESNKHYRNRFYSHILSSDWCSFSTKRKLIIHIVGELSLLEGKEKNDYETLLRKVMSYRNAFAHGELSTDGRIVQIKYYENKLIKKILDDSYFEKVELDLNKCFFYTEQIAAQLIV